jgi:hypothetical protein
MFYMFETTEVKHLYIYTFMSIDAFVSAYMSIHTLFFPLNSLLRIPRWQLEGGRRKHAS